MELRRLTEEQTQFYRTNGYLTGLPPIYDADGVKELNEGFVRLKSMLQEGESTSDIVNWHQTSQWLYDICIQPQILNYVEDILGPDFFMWNTEFITKSPRSEKIVAWHQDAYNWPLYPRHSVTVWLAFTDVDEANGAMRVIPGTHQGGMMRHGLSVEESVNSFELDTGSFPVDSAVSLLIPAGGISLHDDAMIHGSPANVSDRWRISYIIRYSSAEVKYDLGKFLGKEAPVTAGFHTYWMRGVDKYNHNPRGPMPTEPFGRPEFYTRRKRTKEDDFRDHPTGLQY